MVETKIRGRELEAYVFACFCSFEKMLAEEKQRRLVFAMAGTAALQPATHFRMYCVEYENTLLRDHFK
jgi:hypothetical protein